MVNMYHTFFPECFACVIFGKALVLLRKASIQLLTRDDWLWSKCALLQLVCGSVKYSGGGVKCVLQGVWGK